MTRGARAGLVAFVVLLLVAALRGAAAPSLSISKTSARLGEVITVTVQGWDRDVTVSVCGNEARRGGIDCDQQGSVGMAASLTRPQTRQLKLRRPPALCPCVVRAATAGDEVAQVTPIVLAGVGSGELSAPIQPDTPQLHVEAELVTGHVSLGRTLQSLLGGQTHRVLSLTLTNTGITTLTDLSVSASVGRGELGGEPLLAPTIETLRPGETRPYSLPVTLSSPAFGSYHVFGTVYGDRKPVNFAVRTSTTPVLLYVLVVVLGADLAVLATLRLRRRFTQVNAGKWPDDQPLQNAK